MERNESKISEVKRSFRNLCLEMGQKVMEGKNDGVEGSWRRDKPMKKRVDFIRGDVKECGMLMRK